MFTVAIHIDIDPVKTLITEPDAYSQVVANSGFQLYWRKQGRDPVQAAMAFSMGEGVGRAAALDQSGPDKKSVFNSIGRISGASIEQQVMRHLPGSFAMDITITFLPGGDLPLAAQGQDLAVNVFALEQRLGKLFLADFPLLSLLANRAHRLCTLAHFPDTPGTTCAKALSNFIGNMLKEGCATLFFTMPVAGTVYEGWQQAETRRDSEIQLLRRLLQVKEGDMAPQALAKEMERSLSLTGSAELAAKYPLGTWMCQVIESAFGRSRLVELLQQPDDFINTFEQARNKFGLADKYSVEVRR